MMTILALMALCLASWLTALERALRNGPRSELAEHLDKTGRESLRIHLDARMDWPAAALPLPPPPASVPSLCAAHVRDSRMGRSTPPRGDIPHIIHNCLLCKLMRLAEFEEQDLRVAHLQ